MILAALLLQHVAVPGLPESVVIPGPAPRPRHVTAPAVAINLFRDICLAHLRDRAGIGRAARKAGLKLGPDSRSDLGGDTYRRGDLILHYNMEGSLHPESDQPQCHVRAWLNGSIGEGAFERRFVASVRPGSLVQRGHVLQWERVGSDGRVEKIALQTAKLSYGQISAILSTGLAPRSPEGR